jgi:hypothetical protein
LIDKLRAFPLMVAAAIYLLFAAAVYSPVLAGLRFFWEDFMNQEYPIRDFAFTSIGWLHHIPLWNPYSWAWAPFSADPQSAMWYPGNLLEIVLTRFLLPSVQHLPVLIPEMFGILHLPLGALGCFVLARHRFKLDFLPALLAGFLWGFGTRMFAEQNHPMTVEQWLWLPWCAHYMLRALDEYRYVFAFALVLGTSFLLGQPQISLFNATFLGCWLIYELWRRWMISHSGKQLLRSIALAMLGFVIAASLSAAQYVQSVELSKESARSGLTFNEAGTASITFGQLVGFFVPRALGENPGETGLEHRQMIEGDASHWEAAFSWSVLGEVLAAYALWKLWSKRKNKSDPHTRDLQFFVGFSIFAFLFGLGYHLGFQWIIWKFVPMYDRVRAPARMIMYLSFAGAILSGVGFQLFLDEQQEAWQGSRRFMSKALVPFLFFSLLGLAGFYNLFGSDGRGANWYLSAPTLVISILALLFLRQCFDASIRSRRLAIGVVAIVLLDLFYSGITWHRNIVDPQESFERVGHSEIGILARENWQEHTTKMLGARGDIGMVVRNVGMYLRVPIEIASDSQSMKYRNPMKLNRSFVPSQDPQRNWRIMGVSEIVDTTRVPIISPLDSTLAFLKLYESWTNTSSDSATGKLLDDPQFDFQKQLIVERVNPHSIVGSQEDSITSFRISEDSIVCTIHTTAPAILLVNDLFYKRWIAKVDGTVVPIQRAFTALRAVPIEKPGAHNVMIYYDDSALKLGGGISITALVICLLGSLIGCIRARKAQAAGLGAGGGSSRA